MNEPGLPHDPTAYAEFLARFELLISKKPSLITNTLSNVFTMRLIGNKAHGDMGEIAIAEFVNQFMYDYEADHVGKDRFRSKSSEEDIVIRSLITDALTPISLKAYGDGPLQLSTDKASVMYPYLEQFGEDDLSGSRIEEVYSNPAFGHFNEVNVLPLIYRENDYQCNILIFDNARAREETARIYRVGGDSGRGRKHPIWRFEDINGGYIAEVRYGDARANALQRGFWTHTKNALPYFKSVTRGWIDYSHNLVLVELFAKALNATQAGHTQALMAIERDLLAIKEAEGIV